MVKRVCAICGLPTSKLIDNLCFKCYRNTHRILKLPPLVEITICRDCFSYLEKGNWCIMKEHNIVDAIKKCIARRIESKLKPLGEVKMLQINVHLSRIPSTKDNIPVEVQVLGRAHQTMEYYKETYRTNAKVKYKLCPNCKAIASRKEKAIIQVRAKGRKLSEEEMREIIKIAHEELEKLYKRDRGAILVDEVVGNGILDFKLISLNAARKLAHTIQVRYMGKILETVKQIGTSKTGRRIVRATIRVLLPPVRKGEIIVVDRTPYLVKEISRGTVKLTSLVNYKEKNISLSNIFREDIMRVSSSDIRKALVMSVNPPFITLMLLDDYTIMDLRRDIIPLWIKEGDTIDILSWNNILYILPQLTKSTKT